eukprot:SAG22_NODE_723_length_7636_cov_75.271726_2_plen_166_part_00
MRAGPGPGPRAACCLLLAAEPCSCRQLGRKAAVGHPDDRSIVLLLLLCGSTTPTVVCSYHIACHAACRAPTMLPPDITIMPPQDSRPAEFSKQLRSIDWEATPPAWAECWANIHRPHPPAKTAATMWQKYTYIKPVRLKRPCLLGLAQGPAKGTAFLPCSHCRGV